MTITSHHLDPVQLKMNGWNQFPGSEGPWFQWPLVTGATQFLTLNMTSRWSKGWTTKYCKITPPPSTHEESLLSPRLPPFLNAGTPKTILAFQWAGATWYANWACLQLFTRNVHGGGNLRALRKRRIQAGMRRVRKSKATHRQRPKNSRGGDAEIRDGGLGQARLSKPWPLSMILMKTHLITSSPCWYLTLFSSKAKLWRYIYIYISLCA